MTIPNIIYTHDMKIDLHESHPIGTSKNICSTDASDNLLSFFFCLDVAQGHMNEAPNENRT